MSDTIEIEKEFGDLRSFIGKCFDLKLEGAWHGSTFRYHPRGVIRGGIKLIDHWNTNNYRDIVIATDPNCKWNAPVDASFANGDGANPKPIGCDEIVVWSSGKWRKGFENGPWVDLIIDLLRKLKAEVDVKQAEKDSALAKEKARLAQEALDKEQNLKSAWAKASTP